jgi:hypothetical protein
MAYNFLPLKNCSNPLKNLKNGKSAKIRITVRIFYPIGMQRSWAHSLELADLSGKPQSHHTITMIFFDRILRGKSKIFILRGWHGGNFVKNKNHLLTQTNSVFDAARRAEQIMPYDVLANIGKTNSDRGTNPKNF